MSAANTFGVAMNAVTLVDALIRSFRSVRLASSFNDDFDECLIQLDIACWKLSSWHSSRPADCADKDEIMAVLLSSIEEAFRKTKSIVGYKDDQYTTSESLYAKNIIHRTVMQLHEHIYKHIKCSSQAWKAAGRTLWVLHRREDLDRLVATVSLRIDQLVKLFPPDDGMLGRSEDELVAGIESDDQVSLLANATRTLDNSLRNKAIHRMNVPAGHRFVNFNAQGKDNVFGNVYMRGMGQQGTHVGNT